MVFTSRHSMVINRDVFISLDLKYVVFNIRRSLKVKRDAKHHDTINDIDITDTNVRVDLCVLFVFKCDVLSFSLWTNYKLCSGFRYTCIPYKQTCPPRLK